MERLTTNKPVDEMSMLELVYNSCYVGEDGSAMYEDFETVRNARDFVRNLYKIHLNEEMPTDDDVFDESMIDELQYEPEVHLNGLIALFYRNLWAMADLRETLKDYEDREEQGLLIELPCKVGDKAWYVHKDGIDEVEVDSFIININLFVNVSLYVGCERFGKTLTPYKTLFFTRSEAEEALAQMQGGK